MLIRKKCFCYIRGILYTLDKLLFYVTWTYNILGAEPRGDTHTLYGMRNLVTRTYSESSEVRPPIVGREITCFKSIMIVYFCKKKPSVTKQHWSCNKSYCHGGLVLGKSHLAFFLFRLYFCYCDLICFRWFFYFGVSMA